MFAITIQNDYAVRSLQLLPPINFATEEINGQFMRTASVGGKIIKMYESLNSVTQLETILEEAEKSRTMPW